MLWGWANERIISLLFFLSFRPFILILELYHKISSQNRIKFLKDPTDAFNRSIILILLIQLFPVSSHSAIFNIPPEDAGALVDVIDTSNSNGEGDIINLAIGSTYALSPANDFRIPFAAEAFN